jgi:hypothetical protein
MWTDIPDPHTPMGAHGIGEIGITGTAAAVANAVFQRDGKAHSRPSDRLGQTALVRPRAPRTPGYREEVSGWRVARHLGFLNAKRSFGHDASGGPGRDRFAGNHYG